MSDSNAARSWLIGDRTTHTVVDLMDGLARELAGMGMPVWRFGTSLLTAHPEVFSESISWHRDRPCESFLVSHKLARQTLPELSPIFEVWQHRKPVRCRLEQAASIPWSTLREVKAQGGTDYLVLPIIFTSGQMCYFSIATDLPGGFTDEQVQWLLELQAALELRLELLCERHSKEGLLRVYLGPSAAWRVLAGRFRRGEGELIQAAIWYCDLRGFTQLSDRHAVREVVPLLDRYFESVDAVVAAHGGEILKFIGDAVLAIFPVGSRGPADPCRRALAAAETALEQVGMAHQGVALEIGIALHLGEVMFGNIGGRSRLDFTVIGAAVNEVCRVEPLCKALGVPLLLTGEFRAACGEGDTVRLGSFSLRGVSGERVVFTSARHAPKGSPTQDERPSAVD